MWEGIYLFDVCFMSDHMIGIWEYEISPFHLLNSVSVNGSFSHQGPKLFYLPTLSESIYLLVKFEEL